VTGGGVKCWGTNDYGELGGTAVGAVAIPIAAASGAVSVAAGDVHSCAVVSSALLCWGGNADGQVGDGTTTDRFAPMPIPALAGARAVAVSAGAFHTCALVGDARVLCWGSNASGQLGDGTTNDHTTPVDVAWPSPPASVTAIAAGRFHTCAVTSGTRGTSGGQVFCWGSNVAGQLGDGTTTDRSAPVAVGVSDAVGIAAGNDHTCAVLDTGSVRCWGSNDSGQLGDGTFTSNPFGVDVTGLRLVAREVGAGAFHTCALGVSGGVQCWGLNAVGELGDGTMTTSRPVPGDVKGLTSGVAEIALGTHRSCALLASGGVSCWGQEGDPSHSRQDGVPVPVTGVP
jgi:alpha-tubulin suppressor-like RCC1 family protein